VFAKWQSVPHTVSSSGEDSTEERLEDVQEFVWWILLVNLMIYDKEEAEESVLDQYQFA